MAMALAIVGLLVTDRSASAIPPFAAQTGQPCTACHIGGFGPQLTPLGRAFKISGYTQRGGEGWQSDFPLAAMVQLLPHSIAANASTVKDTVTMSSATSVLVLVAWSALALALGAWRTSTRDA